MEKEIGETTLKLKRWKMPLPGDSLTLAGFSRAGNATFFYVPELKVQLGKTFFVFY